MSKMDLMAKLQNLLQKKKGTVPTAGITRKQLKALRNKRHKPAFSMGFRGFPKTYKPLGSVPAPTIDQVRDLERAYMTRLHVKEGLVHFKEDGSKFTKEEAAKRRKGKMRRMARECECTQ